MLLATKLFPDAFARLDLDKKQIIDFVCQALGMVSRVFDRNRETATKIQTRVLQAVG